MTELRLRPKSKRTSGPGYVSRFVFFFDYPCERSCRISAALLARGYSETTARDRFRFLPHGIRLDRHTRTFDRLGITVRLTAIPDAGAGGFLSLGITTFRP
jgi:hypothetical protein